MNARFICRKTGIPCNDELRGSVSVDRTVARLIESFADTNRTVFFLMISLAQFAKPFFSFRTTITSINLTHCYLYCFIVI